MKKQDLIKELESGRGVLALHGTWSLYRVLDNGEIGISYRGRVNPKTAEQLIAENPKYLAP